MISKPSSYLSPLSLFSAAGLTPSLVLSLDAAGYTSSSTWLDLSSLHNDAISDSLIEWSEEGGGSFIFDGSSTLFYFDKKDFTFDSSATVSYGVTFSSNSVTSTESSGNWTTKQAVSVESYSTKIKLKFQTGANPFGIICGLSDKPYSVIDNYSKPNYGFYINNHSVLTIVEDANFNINLTAGTYSDTTVYEIKWDGSKVKYYVDNLLFYTSTTTPTNPLFLYCTFNPSGQEINNIEYGPYVESIPLGDSPYTIESWFKSNSYSLFEQGSLIGWGSTFVPGYSNVLRLNANGLINYWWGNDIDVSFTGTQSLHTENWYYTVVTYDGTFRKIYLNGQLVETDTPGTPHLINDSSTLEVGHFFTNYFNGYISKLKLHSVSIGSEKILSNFNNDKLRHEYVFGSMLFTSTQSSYLSTSSSDYVIGADDFTIEAFVKTFTQSNYYGVVSMRDYSETGLAINISLTGSPRFAIQGSYHDAATMSVGNWYHLAMSRISGTISCYINGILEHEFSDTNNYTSQDLVVGRYYTNNNDFYLDGLISNVRLIIGSGIYNGTFSFPTAPLEPVDGTKFLIISQQTSPTIDVSGFIPPSLPHLVTNNNSVGWTSSLPFLPEGIIQFEFLDFSNTTGLVTYGDEVTVISNYLYLTPATNNRTGNVFTSTSTNYNRSFTLTWNFECVNGDGADGFCVQWTTINNTFGLGGGGVGRINDASTIVAISFQTYNGNLIYSHNAIDVGVYNVGSTFRQNLYYWLDYNHVTSTIEIFWNSTNTKPGGSPNVTQNSVVFDSSNYYFGFGAATGGLNDQHILKSMKLIFT